MVANKARSNVYCEGIEKEETVRNCNEHPCPRTWSYVDDNQVTLWFLSLRRNCFVFFLEKSQNLYINIFDMFDIYFSLRAFCFYLVFILDS